MKNNLNGCVFVFTGTLTNFTRKEVNSLIISLQGKVGSSITKETTHLVVGAYSKSLFDEQRLTLKEEQALLTQETKNAITILNEFQFLNLIKQIFTKKISRN